MSWAPQLVWKVRIWISDNTFCPAKICSKSQFQSCNYYYVIQFYTAKNWFFTFTFRSLICPVTKLAPKKWGLSDGSSTALVAFFGGVSFLISQGIDLRPNLAVILGLAIADSIFLGGTCLAQISSYWPPYKRRILIHEAGHLLIGIFICFLRASEVTSYFIPLYCVLPYITPYKDHPN